MLSTALDMARQGLGAVFMPDFVATLHNETQLKEFHLFPVDPHAQMPRIRREVFLLKRSGADETPEMKKLVAGVRDQLKLRNKEVREIKS
jgi:DNA-binding transcriptional LysR family regulator